MDQPTTSGCRQRRALVTLIVAGLITAACGGDSTDSSGDDAVVAISSTTLPPDVGDVTPGGTLVVSLEADPISLSPGSGLMDTNVARAIFDSVAVRGADGQIHPYLAESIDANDDVTEWTVTLRPGIVFHDGTPLDAQAIKENFDEYIVAEGSSLAGAVALVDELRVDGPLVYTYVLTEANAAFPDVLTGGAGQPFSNVACRAAGESCQDQAVGAGPFKLVRWYRDSEIVLERNENYWRTDLHGNQLPYLDELIFRPIPDEGSRLDSVLAGNAQVGQTLRQSFVRQAESAERDGKIQSLEALGNNGTANQFNVLRPPVDDQRVRLALVHAVDQDAAIAVIDGDGLTPSQTQFFNPSSPWFSASVADIYPSYDPDRAIELLDEYINDPNRSDGKPVGTPVSVEFQCMPDPSLIDIAQTYQAYWASVGVETELNQVEQAVLITNVFGSADQTPPFAGNYMISCWRSGSDQDPYTTLSSVFGGSATSPTNFTNYTSDNLDAQLEVLRTATDFSERYVAAESMMMELAEQVPQFWVGGTATAVFAQPNIRNLGGWTTPEGVLGEGVLNAVLYWSEVWIER